MSEAPLWVRARDQRRTAPSTPPEARNPKPDIQNPKPENRNPKPEIRNPRFRG